MRSRREGPDRHLNDRSFHFPISAESTVQLSKSFSISKPAKYLHVRGIAHGAKKDVMRTAWSIVWPTLRKRGKI